MRVTVEFLPMPPADGSTVAVVVDALRATSAVAAAFAARCPAVYLAPDHDSARAAAQGIGAWLFGETDGVAPLGFDGGNSPVELSAWQFEDRPMVLSTTNGTRLASRCGPAAAVLLGAPVNARACARAAVEAASETESVTVVCAGSQGGFALEDAVAAGVIVERIIGEAAYGCDVELTDSARAAVALWERDPRLIRGWMQAAHAIDLCDAGFGDDVGWCAQVDMLDVAPQVVDQGAVHPWPVHLLPGR